MTRTSRFLGASLLALLGQVCSAQSQVQPMAQEPAPRAPAPRSSDFVITPAIVEKALRYAQSVRALFTERVECNPTGNVCDRVKIYIVQPSDANGTYCVGLIPEIIHFGGTSLGNSQKTIVWEIVPPVSPVPAGSTFEFYGEKEHGIVVLNDANPAQLKGGKLGNANTGNVDPGFYNMKNDHKKPVDAAYLPIIVQKIPASGPDAAKVALCGTPDPRILND